MSPTSYNIISCVIIYLQLQVTISLQITKQAVLTPNTVLSGSLSNISISLGRGTSIVSNLWNINVTSQQGTDLTIQLGSDWGFNPTYPSTMELYIEGNTSNHTYNNDGEIIFIFNVHNQYFAELMSLESRGNNPYKQCPNINTPLINTTDISQILNPLSPDTDRYDRFCSSSWQNTGGDTEYKKAVQWPMFMEIHNHPTNNTLSYSWGDHQTPPGPKFNNLQFTSAFPANQGLNIHISGHSLYETFNIFSIVVTYSYTTTPAPSTHPTMSPTNMPTLPTTFPTTNIPTTALPTYIPTINPTAIPTINPITVPATIYPTYIPTINPTAMPTIYPITIPTIFPTYVPTINPATIQINATVVPISTIQPISTVFQTTQASNAPTINPTAKTPTNLYSTQTTYSEVLESTNYSITSTAESTGTQTAHWNNSDNSEIVLRLNIVSGYIIIAGMLLFGIGCFVVGICFGVTFYKKKLNSDVENDHFNKFNHGHAANVEKQLSKLVHNKNIMNVINITDADIQNSDDEDHESLYVHEKGIFDANSVDVATSGKQTVGRTRHIMVESQSLQMEQQQIRKHTASGEVDDILIVNNVQLQSEHNKQHNPPQVVISSSYDKNSTSLQAPIQQRRLKVDHNNCSDNASVNYADARMDEKEFQRKITSAGNTKKYGLDQLDIFPDDHDEGASVLYSEKSVGYNSSKDIDGNLGEHYNSDPDADEDEKNVQNEATLGIEIEMQTRNSAEIMVRTKSEAAYCKMMEKIMLDKSSSVGDAHDEQVGPLPTALSLSVMNSKSGQHLSSIVVAQHHKVKRKSASEISSSHKSGKSFITLFHEQKDDVIEDLDDDGLDDPEYEEMQLNMKNIQKQQVRGNIGY